MDRFLPSMQVVKVEPPPPSFMSPVVRQARKIIPIPSVSRSCGWVSIENQRCQGHGLPSPDSEFINFKWRWCDGAHHHLCPWFHEVKRTNVDTWGHPRPRSIPLRVGFLDRFHRGQTSHSMEGECGDGLCSQKEQQDKTLHSTAPHPIISMPVSAKRCRKRRQKRPSLSITFQWVMTHTEARN